MQIYKTKQQRRRIGDARSNQVLQSYEQTLTLDTSTQRKDHVFQVETSAVGDMSKLAVTTTSKNDFANAVSSRRIMIFL